VAGGDHVGGLEHRPRGSDDARLASAIPLYEILGPNKRYLAFALFMGVSMSVTAFPCWPG